MSYSGDSDGATLDSSRGSASVLPHDAHSTHVFALTHVLCRYRSPTTPRSPQHLVSVSYSRSCCRAWTRANSTATSLADLVYHPPTHADTSIWAMLLLQVEDHSNELAALGLPVGFGKHHAAVRGSVCLCVCCLLGSH